MKTFTIVLALLFLSSYTNGQEWHLQNPLPQGYSLNSVHFPDSLTGYAVGEYGTIMKTTDAGLTWFSLPGFTERPFLSVYFTDVNTGYLLDDYRIIYKSTDGGMLWDTVYSNHTNYPLNTIYFVDSVTGFATGDGPLLKTIDGGLTWITSLSWSSASRVNSLCFPDENTGYAAGGYGKIAKTTDGGMTWDLLSSGFSNSGHYTGITFADSLTGFVAGNLWDNEGYLILRTRNGGVTWDTIRRGIHGYLTSITCTDTNNVLATGCGYTSDYARYGMIIRTTNGGSNWDSISYEAYEMLNCIRFPTHSKGFIVGVGGKIIRTLNGGDSWEEYGVGSTQHIYSLFFTDRMTGYAVGSNSTILRTMDGGSNWTVSLSNPKGELRSIYFTDKENGYIAGSHGIILKTVDAGQTWTSTPGIDTKFSLRSIHFPDHNTGYAVGAGTFLKTIDAGNTWDTLPNFTGFSMSGRVNNVFFTDQLTGFVVGGINMTQWLDGYIVKTKNGGTTWENVFDNEDYPIYSICFTAPDTGYAVGGGLYWYWGPWPHGIILKTVDNGETWDTLTTMINFPLYSISFTDKNTGFAAGGTGIILKTINAGISWDPVTTCTKYRLNTICFSDAQTGYCAGTNGTIIQTTNAGTGFPEGPNLKNSFIVYPNPGKDLISMELPNLTKDSEGTITIVDITGQSLISKEMRGTKSTLDITSLPAGVYFVTYISHDFTQTVKLIKD